MFMVTDNTKTERIKNNILNKLDKLKYVHRRDSYSKRIAFFIKYCKKDKEIFDQWVKQEVENERK